MKNFTVTYTFFLVLKSKRVKIDQRDIKGNSVLDCSRQAFDIKMELQRQKGGEVLYKKERIEKERKVKREEKKEEKIEDVNISIKSGDLSATEAIKFIKENDLEFLINGQFLSEDEDRTTVNNAFETKQKQSKK